MKLENISAHEVTITFTTDELVFLCNAINETRHGVPAASFQTRTAETPERAKEIHYELLDMLDNARGEKKPAG